MMVPPPRLPSPPQTEKPPKMQWFYDGQSWVYADKQPEIKPAAEEKQKEFDYSFAKNENPVAQAIFNNLRGKYNRRDTNKPKPVPVRCEVCSLTVTCQVTYETHINGRPHKKRVAQMEKLKVEEDKKETARLAQVEIARKKAEAALAGKSIKTVEDVPAVVETPDPSSEEFLQTQPNGDLTCTLCKATMNSLDCANAHIKGKNHRKNYTMMKNRGGLSGRGRGRGGTRGGATRGGRNGAAVGVVTTLPLERKAKEELTTSARAEYDRVFAEALSNNVELPTAEKKALDAMNSVLNGSTLAQGIKARDESAAKASKVALAEPVQEADKKGEDEVDNNGVDGVWPPRGITVLVEPKGFKPGSYRCDLCGVNLASEPILEAHLNSPGHKDTAKNPTIAAARNNRGGQVYRGGRTTNGNKLKAQRGRRGLISNGELMPDTLTKAEKREQRDIAAAIQNHMAKQTGETKVLPLLMNFVRGETIQPE